MTEPRHYSTLFSCLYDQPEPVGSIGRGSHYSVLRSVEWRDVTLTPLDIPQVHDFAIIWDEDHDTRIVEVVEKIYMAGLLASIQFIGERKGMLNIVLAAKCYFAMRYSDGDALADYTARVQALAEADGDTWPVEIGSFDRSDRSAQDGHQTILPGIIQDYGEKAFVYLKHIDNLWRLGTKAWAPAPIFSFPLPPS